MSTSHPSLSLPPEHYHNPYLVRINIHQTDAPHTTLLQAIGLPPHLESARIEILKPAVDPAADIVAGKTTFLLKCFTEEDFSSLIEHLQVVQSANVSAHGQPADRVSAGTSSTGHAAASGSTINLQEWTFQVLRSETPLELRRTSPSPWIAHQPDIDEHKMWYDGNSGLGAFISQLSEEESTGTRGDNVNMSVLPKVIAGLPEDSESESEWGQDHDHDGYVDGWGSQDDEEYFKTLAAEYGGNAGEDYIDSDSTNEQLEVELNGDYEDEKDEIFESHSPSIFEEGEGGDWEEVEERGTESSDLSSEDDRPPSKRRRINNSSNEESSEDEQSFLATSTVSSHAKMLQSAVFLARSTANLVNFEEEPCESSGDPESADSIDEEDSDHAHAFDDDMSDMEEDGQDNDVFVALGDDGVPTEAEGSGQNELDGPENARLMSTGDINEPFSVHGNGPPEMDDEDEEIALETVIRQLSHMGFNDLDTNNAPGPFDQRSTSVMQAQPIFSGDNTQSQLEMAWREFDSFGVNQAKLLGVHAMQALRNILLASSTDEA